MASYNKFNIFVQAVTNKGIDCTNDTFKVGLTNTLPTATIVTYSAVNLTELSTAGGYTQGGATATVSSNGQTSGTDTFVLTNVTWTATSAGIGPFQYVFLYDSTPSTNNMIAWWNYGSALTLSNGSTFTVQFNGGATTGTVFTMT
jgi:hypothetical protein